MPNEKQPKDENNKTESNESSQTQQPTALTQGYQAFKQGDEALRQFLAEQKAKRQTNRATAPETDAHQPKT